MTQMREGNDSAMLHAIVSGWKKYTEEVRNQSAFDQAQKELMAKHNTKSENAVGHALHRWDKDSKVFLRHEVLKVWLESVQKSKDEALEVLKSAKLQRAKEIHDKKMKWAIENMMDGKKGSHSTLRLQRLE